MVHSLRSTTRPRGLARGCASSSPGSCTRSAYQRQGTRRDSRRGALGGTLLSDTTLPHRRAIRFDSCGWRSAEGALVATSAASTLSKNGSDNPGGATHCGIAVDSYDEELCGRPFARPRASTMRLRSRWHLRGRQSATAGPSRARTICCRDAAWTPCLVDESGGRFRNGVSSRRYFRFESSFHAAGYILNAIGGAASPSVRYICLVLSSSRRNNWINCSRVELLAAQFVPSLRWWWWDN